MFFPLNYTRRVASLKRCAPQTLARHEHVGEEVHLHELHALALARLATAAFTLKLNPAALQVAPAGSGRPDQRERSVRE
jgi:hypothetical protein